MLDKIPDDARPIDIVVLTFYPNAFNSQIGLSFKQEEPKNLQEAMEKAPSLDEYLAGLKKEVPTPQLKSTPTVENPISLEESNLFLPLMQMAKEFMQKQASLMQKVEALENDFA